MTRAEANVSLVRDRVASLGLEGAPGVDHLVPILKPYKLASAQIRKGERTVVEIDGRPLRETDRNPFHHIALSTFADLQKYVTASTPYVIKVKGAITITPKGTELKVQSNKTIVGVGTSGHIVGGGFFLGTGVRNTD